jgi:hypothetical protein
MTDPRPDMLRRCLEALQMHAAGMQASAAMALQILGDMRAGAAGAQPKAPERKRGEPTHYGEEPDNDLDMEARFAALEGSGGRAATPAEGGNSPPT